MFVAHVHCPCFCTFSGPHPGSAGDRGSPPLVGHWRHERLAERRSENQIVQSRRKSLGLPADLRPRAATSASSRSALGGQRIPV
ncbi:hypothetical protein JM946_05285 [Steroidobacter sp. S1-65]|uniref:Uncharacterized protein n=1 Tax=Steroidobacter gossypii TaxID=2805490 RepID=A0ABS1WT53_9GAMM|nr:hypothetical protein [Steroidobacter gossypii]